MLNALKWSRGNRSGMSETYRWFLLICCARVSGGGMGAGGGPTGSFFPPKSQFILGVRWGAGSLDCGGRQAEGRGVVARGTARKRNEEV